MTAPNVLLPRGLILNTKGEDVIAVKHALSRAGYMKWGKFTDVYGTHARDAVHALQKDHKISPAGYGVKTHHVLSNLHRVGHQREWAFDTMGVALMEDEYEKLHTSPENRIRNEIVQMARYLYANRYYVGYGEVRPVPLLALGAILKGKGYRWDCSGNVMICYHAAGAKNPNRNWQGMPLPWNGEGYTQTLLMGGIRTSRDKLKPGDLVFYGFTVHETPAFPYGSPTHVAMWEDDVDLDVFSDGSFPQRHARFDYRRDIHSYMTYDVTP